ncbi:NUDIX domain-containing protein [Nocardia transvalensis]|uniref:NUDIX domain-containing protein n=1 Tax=Nocardia transvalensis TaxID=37333 RepID=UPI001E42981B|nr:NUDIX hydrolase [Nocardia transvalensis]
MRVREDTVLRPDGGAGIYGVIERANFAMIIPMDGDRLHLVEQFRYPVNRRCWEFPAGSPPPGTHADPIDLAHRELREETGLRARSMTYLGALDVAAGMTAQRGHVYLATDLTAGPPQRECEEQDMRSTWLPRVMVESMINAGEISEASSVAAYTLLLLHERGGGAQVCHRAGNGNR